MIDSVLNTGLTGVQKGLNRVQNAASDIVNAGTGVDTGGSDITAPPASDALTSLTQAIIDLKLGERQVEASAQVVRTADEILGTIIDIHA